MVLYLFGGSSKETEARNDSLISEQLVLLQPQQLLYIDFARNDEERRKYKLDKIRKTVAEKIKDCQFLYAHSRADIEKATHPLIYISGGDSNARLLAILRKNPRLLEVIKNAQFYFGSSAGAMIAGEKVRGKDGKPYLAGLNILKRTIVEPHYTQENRQNQLRREMKEWNCRYGIGLDEACGIIIDPQKFPGEYQKIGDGVVEVIRSNSEDLNPPKNSVQKFCPHPDERSFI